ncbi:MAG TPA: hypothetical protein VN625_09950 [Desulfuromonadaceae bacterium]|nr:hypothetical protein [Desulfuromonadaceae bacterium]
MSAIHANFCRVAKLFPKLFCLIFVLGLPAKADTTAVTTGPTADFTGFASSPIGFAFTPLTNLVVSQVNYIDHGETQPIIRFWSGNSAFATFNLPAGSNTGQTISTNVTLTLFAGQNYVITFQDGTNGFTLINEYLTFQLAPQLTNYSVEVYQSGSFTNFGSNFYVAGPNFTFTNATGVVASPVLSITQNSPTNVTVTWPAPSTGFVLQRTPSLDSPAWTVVTNVVTIGGTNQFSDVVISNRFYRLYHP